MGVSLRTIQMGTRPAQASGPAEALLANAEQKPEVFTELL